jgi:hypothetical protein
MKKYFVTYDQAVALKELGLDKPCFVYYNPNGVFMWKILCSDEDNDHTLSIKDIMEHKAEGYIEAPLKQQAILFLLNKCDDLHGAELSIEYFGDESGILKNYGGNFNSLSQAIDKLIMLANDKMP